MIKSFQNQKYCKTDKKLILTFQKVRVRENRLLKRVTSRNYNCAKFFYPIARSTALDNVKPNISKTITPFISLKNLAAVVLHDS